MISKIAFGGGCHWCTEAIYKALIGVMSVDQGFVASDKENNTFSEAVIVHYNAEKIDLSILINVHLSTHKSSSLHSMRKKYRSAIYVFYESEKEIVNKHLQKFQVLSKKQIITKVLLFKEFKASEAQFKNYYFKNPQKPFCKRFINPKLKLLVTKFSNNVNLDILNTNNFN